VQWGFLNSMIMSHNSISIQLYYTQLGVWWLIVINATLFLTRIHCWNISNRLWI
jgi:hypothetical protein